MFREDIMFTQISEEERSSIAQVAKLIVDTAGYEISWKIILDMFGFGDILEDVPRLIKSQRFGDSDYPDNVYRTLELAYEINPRRALAMMTCIIRDIGIEEQILEHYPGAKAIIENKEVNDLSRLLPKVNLSFTPYLQITDVPDPFYRDLIELINKCYVYEIYPAVLIFSRKLLENLLVDILRKKYGMQNVELFFDTNRRRFRSFNELLKNFKDRLEEFRVIIPNLDNKFIEKINEFREVGNSSAHSLECTIPKEWLDEKREELEYVVKVLIRLYKHIY